MHNMYILYTYYIAPAVAYKVQQIMVDSPRPIAHTSTMILAQDKSTIPIIAICHFLSGL